MFDAITLINNNVAMYVYTYICVYLHTCICMTTKTSYVIALKKIDYGRKENRQHIFHVVWIYCIPYVY